MKLQLNVLLYWLQCIFSFFCHMNKSRLMTALNSFQREHWLALPSCFRAIKLKKNLLWHWGLRKLLCECMYSHNRNYGPEVPSEWHAILWYWPWVQLQNLICRLPCHLFINFIKLWVSFLYILSKQGWREGPDKRKQPRKWPALAAEFKHLDLAEGDMINHPGLEITWTTWPTTCSEIK